MSKLHNEASITLLGFVKDLNVVNILLSYLENEEYANVEDLIIEPLCQLIDYHSKLKNNKILPILNNIINNQQNERLIETANKAINDLKGNK